MNLKLAISVLETIYLSYMFYFFKTGSDFNILKSPEGYFFKHLIGDEVGLRICLFGRIIIIPLLILLLIRNFVKIPEWYITGALVIAFVMSFININALIYLLPVFSIELLISFYEFSS